MNSLKRGPLTVFIMISFFMVTSRSALCLSVSEENEISREFMKRVAEQYEIIDDPEISSYIQKIGDRILATYPSQPFKYQFYVVRHNVYNAFAGPGAQIFIHSGLLESLDSEDELVGIMSHEIAHSTCRHISQNIERSGKIGLGTLAGVAAGIFLGIYGNAAAGSALTIGSIAGSESAALSFSREDEMQADKIGMDHLNAIGYSGKGMVNALNKIRGREWYGKEQIPTYMMTHPALEDRISYLQNWLDVHPESRKQANPDAQTDFLMIRTKLSAMYGNPDEEKNKFQSLLEKDKENQYAMYGMGIIHARAGKADEAILCLKKVLEKKAFHTGVLKTLGKVYVDSGRYANAQSVFEGALGVMPNDYECNLYMGRVYIESGKLDQAMDLIMPFGSDEKGEANAYFYLGDIYTRKGKLLESCYYLGMFYKKKRDGKNALIQFERALKIAQKSDMKQKIQKNIDELKGVETKDKPMDQPGKKGLVFRGSQS